MAWNLYKGLAQQWELQQGQRRGLQQGQRRGCSQSSSGGVSSSFFLSPELNCSTQMRDVRLDVPVKEFNGFFVMTMRTLTEHVTGEKAIEAALPVWRRRDRVLNNLPIGSMPC